MAKYVVNADKKKSQISKHIYGHFSEHLGRCIYEGLYVGEDSEIPNVKGMRIDVVEALKEMKVPMLRWPGGCFADEYHWKDGIGPKENRKKMINTHWGGVVEDNSFGTHEFMELCEQIGCEPYICGNVGSGTVQEMSEWVEYMTFEGLSPMAKLREENGRKEPWKVKFFGVGNENWGCGGNMRAEYYADEYRRYQTYCRNYGDNKLFKIAGGPNSADYHWMEVLMESAHNMMDGVSLHYYTVPNEWTDKGAATEFEGSEYYRTMKKSLFMEEMVIKHSAIMDKFDPDKKVALVVDEWGSWYNVEPGTNPGFLYQQNTMRDAMIAGLNLNIFNKYAERVRITNIAQIVNVLQSVILTEGEKMILTPTYHVFEMYKDHQDATLLDSFITSQPVGIKTETEESLIPDLYESASIDEAGRIIMTICNMSLDKTRTVEGEILGTQGKSTLTAEIIANEVHAHNTFEQPDVVTKVSFSDYEVIENTGDKLTFKATLPACSVTKFVLA